MSQNLTTTLSLPSGNLAVPTGLFIHGNFVPSADNAEEALPVVNPYTEEIITAVVGASAKDIDIAVASARKAFQTTWGKNVLPTERARLLNRLADLIERDKQILAELESLNSGKPVRFARDGDITDTIACLRYYGRSLAGYADKVHGKTIEVNEKAKFMFTKREAIGVCGQMSWKVAPALAVGCTIVMKPSENTPLTALIAFTGSTITGRKILEASAHSNLKKVTLELGGKSPHLIFESADLEQAARWAFMGITWNSGQDCTAGSRVFVQSSIYDKFIKILLEKAKEFVVGDPFDPQTAAGPVISKVQYDRVWNYIASGKKEGAKVVLGGEKREGKGFFVDPCIFTDVTSDMKIFKEEIFGPVLAIAKFDTEEEAIAIANNTTYGLAAGLHSTDASQCLRVASAFEAGTVWINNYNILSNNVPFGGYKQSGIGRELGEEALSEYTIVKAVHWNFGEQLDWPL
ncbi:hypothetical protein Clacol_001709 [Clathrus columnatus]|uniref:Aldehyde dehydrogenase domain-containing protein n=1 Tax=Clathrus columnatus TaxID=1419009 RepID=A0AAV5A1M8_9AGAM|nr:hypothetical protein Clacol_001709 [Clathrus columnatus]